MKKKIFLAVLVAVIAAACCLGIVLLCNTVPAPSHISDDEAVGTRVDVKNEDDADDGISSTPPFTEDETDTEEPPADDGQLPDEKPDLPGDDFPSEDPVTPPGDGETPEEEHLHSVIHFPAKDATCTEAGTIEFWYCSECGKYFTGADLKNEVEGQVTIAPAGHTPVTDEAVKATCTTSGLTEGSHCSVCGEVFVAQSVIEPSGHDFADGICKNCGEWKVSEGLDIELTAEGYVVYGLGTCTDKNVRIPDNVSKINYLAFGSEEITGIYIPANVKVIDEYAFYYCTDLVCVYLEDGVEEISDSAFYGCTNLSSVRMSNSLRFLGFSAFEDCRSLTEIIIPSGVKIIGTDAFSGCINLVSVYIVDGAEHIGNNAFKGCESLKNVYLPGSLLTIGQYAFYGCTSLEEIIIPAGTESIGAYAFSGCSALETVIISGSPAEDGDAFTDCPARIIYINR